MADVTLTAELRANIDGYEKNIKSAVKSTVDGSKQIDAAIGKANQSIKGINPASNSAAFALTNLGRVAQDAPFGFIGIQNNLNPLLESFQRLKEQSGSTGAALKALGGSLIGPAGLGLALSLVSSAIVLYTQYQQRANAALNNTKKSTDDYVATLDNVRQAQLKGEQSAAQETTRLAILYNATQNTTLSLKQRGAAYDELSTKYPKFFSNTAKEQTLLGQNTEAYYKLSSAILSAAYAKAYEDKIGQNTNRVLEDRQKLIDLTIAETKARAAVNRLEASAKDNTNYGGQGSAVGDSQFIQQAQENLNKVLSAKENILIDIGILSKRNDDLARAATTAESDANFKTNGQLDDKIAKTKQLRLERQQLEELGATDFSARSGIIDRNGAPVVKSNITNTTELVGASKILADYTAQYGKLIDQKAIFLSQQEIEKNNLGIVNNLFGQGLTGAFESAIQGTQSFVGAMGQFLGQLISKLVAAALAAAALSALLSFTGVGGLLGISSGASGFGSLFKGLSGLNFLADGGIASKPTLAMIGEGKEPEIVAPLSKFDAMVDNRAGMGGAMTVTHKIVGSDLLLVIDRANKSKGRTS